VTLLVSQDARPRPVNKYALLKVSSRVVTLLMSQLASDLPPLLNFSHWREGGGGGGLYQTSRIIIDAIVVVVIIAKTKLKST
jgi:hypothetical protein